MTEDERRPDRAEVAKRLERLFDAKARAELKAADAILTQPAPVRGHGDPLAEVLLVKGEIDPPDVAAGRPMSAGDGEAARKALDALGLDPDSIWATCSATAATETTESRGRRLAMTIEAIDPRIVIAMDRHAAADLVVACGVPGLPAGKPVVAGGRVLGALDGLAASMASPDDKARVWRQFKAVAEPVVARREGKAAGRDR